MSCFLGLLSSVLCGFEIPLGFEDHLGLTFTSLVIKVLLFLLSIILSSGSLCIILQSLPTKSSFLGYVWLCLSVCIYFYIPIVFPPSCLCVDLLLLPPHSVVSVPILVCHVLHTVVVCLTAPHLQSFGPHAGLTRQA